MLGDYAIRLNWENITSPIGDVVERGGIFIFGFSRKTGAAIIFIFSIPTIIHGDLP